MKKIIFFLSLAVILTANGLFAKENILIINNDNQLYSLTQHVSCFVNDKEKIEFGDILTMKYQSKFDGSLEHIPDLFPINAAVWCKFSIENRSEENAILEIKNPALDSIELFILNDDGRLIHHELTGNFMPVGLRNIKSNNYMLDLHTAPGQKRVCYLRLKSGSSGMYFPMEVSSLKKFYETRHLLSLSQGLYFGIILFLVIYNIFLFVTLKDDAYIYFSLLTACIGLLFALTNGFGAGYLWEEWPWLSQYIGLLTSLSGIFAIMFTSSFLKVRIKAPKKYIWFSALIAIYMITIILNLSGLQKVSIKLIEYNSLVALFFLILAGISAWKGGFHPAKFYLFALSFFVTGAIIFQLKEIDILKPGILTDNILQISSTVTIIFMAFSLAKKINIYIEKRDEALQLALKTAIQNERLVANQNKMLETRVTEKTKDLEQTINTLKRQGKELGNANKFKDKIFSVISHDLKSPLSTLNGLLDLLRIKSLNEDEKEKIIENLELALDNTRKLLDDILTWVTRKKDTTEKSTEIDIHSLIEDIRQLFKFQAKAKKIEILNYIEADTHIIAEKNMLQTVLRNIISNALKFTPDNGNVEVYINKIGNETIISVKDNGVGIAPDIQQKLLNENEYYSTRGTKNEKGTGLGLTLCKEFLEKNDGKISIESIPGEGSTFNIHLKNTKIIPLRESAIA